MHQFSAWLKIFFTSGCVFDIWNRSLLETASGGASWIDGECVCVCVCATSSFSISLTNHLKTEAYIQSACTNYFCTLHCKICCTSCIKWFYCITFFYKSWSRLRGMCVRVAVLIAGGALLVWARIRVMATGAPQFKPIDNPASFADSWMTRVLTTCTI